MTHPTIDKLARHVNWANNTLRLYLESLTEDELRQQPTPTTPPIGWHIWHHARFADLFQASFPDQEEIWTRDNLIAVCELDLSRLGPMQLGTGITAEDATYIPTVIGKQRLLDYTSAVFGASDHVMSNLSVDDLGKSRLGWFRIDLSTTPYTEIEKASESILMDQIDWYLSHANRHLGMIEALVDVMFDRDGTATV